MPNPYVGEIRIFAGNAAPDNWALCQGQLLSISQYEALFALIGTTYGGDGVSTFALPDLRGRVPVNQGQGPGLGNYPAGLQGGLQTVTLVTAQLPAHSHTAFCLSTAGTTASPTGNYWAADSATKQYASSGTFNVALNTASIGMSGGSGDPPVTSAHDNMLPYLGINFIIALVGIWPSQT